jgi:hypothetical protein
LSYNCIFQYDISCQFGKALIALSIFIQIIQVQKVVQNAITEITVAIVFFLFSSFFVSKALNKNIIKNIVSTNTKILKIIVVDISKKLLI